MEQHDRMDDRAYEWAFQVWASASEQATQEAHLATSLLYDLASAEHLPDRERAHAEQHLQACEDCHQALQDMRAVFAGCTAYAENVPLAAASGEASAKPSLTQTTDDKIQIMQAQHGEVTVLRLDVAPTYLEEFDNKYIRVFDAHDHHICHGKIVAGRVSWRLLDKPEHPLRLFVESTAS